MRVAANLVRAGQRDVARRWIVRAAGLRGGDGAGGQAGEIGMRIAGDAAGDGCGEADAVVATARYARWREADGVRGAGGVVGVRIWRRGKADVWDSGKVESSDSIGVVYGGPAMQASKRYFWRVLVWDRDGKAYPASDATWWETGLLRQENWKAKWIGFEEAEERAVRESGAKWITNAETGSAEKEKSSHAFRFHFSVSGTVKRAAFVCDG